jgi:hypothetical protein
MRQLLATIVARSVMGVRPAPSLQDVNAWARTDWADSWGKAPSVLVEMSLTGLHLTDIVRRFPAADGTEMWVADWRDPDPKEGIHVMEVRCWPHEPSPQDLTDLPENVIPLRTAGRRGGPKSEVRLA